MERVDLSYIASLLEVLLGIFSLKSEPSPYSTACVQGAQGGGGAAAVPRLLYTVHSLLSSSKIEIERSPSLAAIL